MTVFLEGSSKVGVILFHAYTGSTADVNFLAHELHNTGYTVLCPLFKGHGTQNVQHILDETPATWWEETKEAVHQMNTICDKVFVFGLSMGGMFATRALMELNVVAGGCFNSPIVPKKAVNLDVPFMQYAKWTYQKRGELDRFSQDEADILAKHRQQLAAIQAFVAGYRPRLETIEQPYYIAQSAKDELIDADDAYELQNALENAAMIDFHWFTDNTHVITVNPNRKDFEQSVLQFIEKVLKREEEHDEFIK